MTEIVVGDDRPLPPPLTPAQVKLLKSDPPAFLTLVPAAEFAAVREASAEPLLGDRDTNALPAGGLGLVFGDGGAGKTTLLLDLAYHLAAGRDEWLALPIPRRCRVVWIENEGNRGTFRDKVDRKLRAWEAPAVDDYLCVLDEPWAALTFANELHLDQLAQALEANETDILITGPLQSLGIEGGGTPTEVTAFEALIRSLRERISRPICVILIHHENRAGQMSGAWDRVPETTMHVTAQGNGKTRLHWKKARSASTLHGTAWHLNWTEGEGFELDDKPEVTEDTIAEQILEAITATPGASWSKIRDGVRGKATDAAKVRDRLLAADQIVNLAPRDGYFELWHSDDPAASRSHAGTGRERLTVPPAERAAEPSPFPVPYVSRNGKNGNGTAPSADNPERDLWLDSLERAEEDAA